MNIGSAIITAKNILEKKFSKSPDLDSEILMSKTIEKDRKYLMLNLEKNLGKDKLNYFTNLVVERLAGKPIAYITNRKDFWKYEFEVRKDSLIPRPDTELLIEQTLNITKNKSNLRVLDIGVGSGCILLSILKEKKDFYGTGIDISKKCITLSKINASRLQLTDKVKFFNSDVDNFNIGKYDLIISNPPYIKKLELRYLDRDIINFEPKLALDGGLDGLSVIRKVINKSSELIKKDGKFILEIGFDQKNKVKKLLKNKGFYINKVLKDLAKNDRCIVSTKI